MAPAYSLSSVDEIREVALIAKRLHAKYAVTAESSGSGSKSSSRDVVTLVETIGYYSVALDDLATTLTQYRDASIITSPQSFRGKLVNCEKFLDPDVENVVQLRRRKSSIVDIPNILKRGIEAIKIKHGSSDTRTRTLNPQALHRELSLEIGKLLSYIFLTALRRDAPVQDGATQVVGDRSNSEEMNQTIESLKRESRFGMILSGTLSASEFRINSEDTFSVVLGRLIRLRSFYFRGRSAALQQNVSENLLPLRQILENIWLDINARVGAHPSSLLPTNIRNVFEGPHHNFNAIMLELTNESQHQNDYGQAHPFRTDTMGSTFTSPMMRARTSSFNTTPRESPSILGSSAPRRDAPSFTLPGTAYHVAIMALEPDDSGEINLYLQRWDCVSSSNSMDDENIIEWKERHRADTIAHYIPRGAIPRLEHGNKAGRQRDVFFHEEHRGIWRTDNRIGHDKFRHCRYIFHNKDLQVQFMEDIRNKVHIQDFDTGVIWTNVYHKTNRAGNKEGLGTHEKVIFWKDREWPYRHTFTFTANKTRLGQLEYPLLAFKEAKLSGDIVRLEPNNVPPSLRTIDQLEAASSVPEMDLPDYIKLEFSGRYGCTPRTDARRFVSTFDAAWKADTIIRPRNSTSSNPSPVASPEIQSQPWSPVASTTTFQYMPPRLNDDDIDV